MQDAKITGDHSGYFLVAFIDLLGTDTKNAEIKAQSEFPAEMLEREITKVKTFQRDFDQIVEGQSRAEKLLKSQRPESLRTAFETLQGNVVTRYAFSDSLIFFVSLNTQQNRLVPVESCFTILVALVCAQLWSLARGCPFRGGVEIGRAAVFNESQILGPALSDAVKLEKQAQIPRILIGDEIYNYLHLNRQLPLDTPEKTSNRTFADLCMGLIVESDEPNDLCRNDDANESKTHVRSLNVHSDIVAALIGERHQEQLNKAGNFAEHEIQRFSSNNEKLACRYHHLLNYLREGP